MNRNSSFLAAIVALLFIPTLYFQVLWNFANAEESDSPITYPITFPEPSSTPEPSVSPTPTSSPTPDPTRTPESSGNSNNSNSLSAAGGSGSAPGCNDAKPGSAPYITSVQLLNGNKALLSWNKAQEPVTHYSIVFGTKPGLSQFGNPNVGNVTRYRVTNLSPKVTYYFRVRANNGCNGSELSNELSSKPARTGTKVLSKAIIKVTTPFKRVQNTESTPKVKLQSNTSIFKSLNSFVSSKLSSLFN